ncbi:protein piccolo [Bombina bombina]|uniref:protein piccolo n=1 Tax=Bombina bombina TaxID=8345 RepID=UPI00235AD779|nr:protein piccolo [Bombina bombina]
MGNEGSMEGGEGIAGYPGGVVSDGKGGFVKIPSGMEADLSQLSEEERKQIAAVMSRAQELPRGSQPDRPMQRHGIYLILLLYSSADDTNYSRFPMMGAKKLLVEENSNGNLHKNHSNMEEDFNLQLQAVLADFEHRLQYVFDQLMTMVQNQNITWEHTEPNIMVTESEENDLTSNKRSQILNLLPDSECVQGCLSDTMKTKAEDQKATKPRQYGHHSQAATGYYTTTQYAIEQSMTSPARNPEIDKNMSPRHPKPPDPGPAGISKSKTVDAFKPEMKTPGRSPSTMSLREPRSKQDIKEESKPSMMTSFLSDSNPLSVVSSVVNKFNPFDAKSDSEGDHEEPNRKVKSAEREHEKIEDLKGKLAQQQSPRQTQQPGDTKFQPTKTTASISVPHQPSQSVLQQNETKPISLQSSPVRTSTQPSDATKPHAPTPVQKEHFPHVRDPVKPLVQDSRQATSLSQKPEPKKESTGQDKTAAPLPRPVTDKQPIQQPGPPKQSVPGDSKSHLQPSQPVKKSKEELDKLGHPQSTAKQSVQQTGPKPPSQQMVEAKRTLPQVPIKPPLQQPGPAAQTSRQLPPTTSSNAKPLQQKLESTKPTNSKPTSQTPVKPAPNLPQPIKAAPEKPVSLSQQKPQLTKLEDQSQHMNKTAAKTMCPLCKTTELLLNMKEKPNYNTCTQCQTTVCSLCGFNPNPHITEIKEWLCLNCQMQRAMGMDMASVPTPTPQPPKQKPVISASPSRKPLTEVHTTQKKEESKPPDQTVTQSPKKPPILSKQVSVTDSPTKSKQPPVESKVEIISPKISTSAKGDQSTPEKKLHQSKQVQPTHGAPPSQVQQTKPESTTSKPDISTVQKDVIAKTEDVSKPIKNAHAVEEKSRQTDKLPSSGPLQDSKQSPVSGFESKILPKSESTKLKDDPMKAPSKPEIKQIPKEPQIQTSPKPSPSHKPTPTPQQTTPQPTMQPQKPQKAQEQTRRFSLNLGSMTETPKPQPTTPQDTVTGKLFGFGASIFSKTSSFMSTAAQPGPQTQSTTGTVSKQPPHSQQTQETAPQKATKEPVPVPQPAKTPAMKKETKPEVGKAPEESKIISATKETQQKNIQEKKVETQSLEPKMFKEAATTKVEMPEQKTRCPLCKTELNIGTKDPCNYNTCTECKSIVCNLCGFNPTPHLTEVKEWLCLTCQTNRAMSEQLGNKNQIPPSLGISLKSSPKKDTSLPVKTKENITDQAIKKEVPIVPDGKTTIIAAHVDQETIQENKMGVIKSIAEDLKKSLSPGTVDGLPVKEQKDELIKDIALVSKDRTETIIQAEEKKILPKHDLMIDLAAVMLKDVNEGEADGFGRSEASQLTNQDIAKEKTEKEDDKSDTSSSQQQKSPQGLSDTGYSSDGISGSLGEIPSLIPSDEKDLPKETSKPDSFSQEGSPSSPSDLAKLESTVLPILEAQTSVLADERRKNSDLFGIYSGQTQDRGKMKMLPITPDSYSSEEEELEDIQEEDETLEENGKGRLSSRRGKDSTSSVTSRRGHDSLDDSSESENSPVPQRKRRTSNGSSSSDDYKHEDSQGSGDDEDFIRKQIIEMSADEDASGSEDEEFLRTKLKEISANESLKKESKGKATVAKCKRLTKKSSTTYDDDGIRRHSWHDDDEEDEGTYDESPELKYRETKSQETEELAVSGGGGLRRFKTIELNSTISSTYTKESGQQSAILYYDEEPELEMESLTDSPEDRSREERSSSLHASSFTPGTSPTSVSSLDEDSDSSPSHKKISGESKHRKSRHRSHGPVLPTIEDSSEEEELREEEELLKEQERQREIEQQQRKSSSKKSKKDKDELRAQRRRERPKTPPSNLSPIEDASPTEELRQAAEMEELHRSSCSEYSPSIESDPEGFEINPEKIIEVQKVYKLPTSVSLYSPTDVTTVAMAENKNGQSLKSAEEAYEEILYKAKLYQSEKEKDDVFEKEPLYGGMLIEDYIYESLVEENYDEELDSGMLSGQKNVFEHRVINVKNNSTDDICIDVVPKITHLENECFRADQFNSAEPQEDIVSSSYIVPESHEIIILENTDEKPPQESDRGFELIDCQNMQLTPGSSPTQPFNEFSLKTDSSPFTSVDICEAEDFSSTSSLEACSNLNSLISIPDVTITQHFTEEDLEDDLNSNENMEKTPESSVSAASDKYQKHSDFRYDSPSVKEDENFSFANAGTEYIIKHDSVPDTYRPSLPPEHVEPNIVSDKDMPFSQSQASVYSTKSSTVSSIANQFYADSVTIVPETSCSITDVSNLDHVIISVPDDTQFNTGIQPELYKSTVDSTNYKIEQSVSGASSYLLKNSYEMPATTEGTPSTVHFVSSAGVTSIVTDSHEMSSVGSVVPSVTSKVVSFFRSSSLDSPAPTTAPAPPPPPPPPPLPPPTPPKPAIYSKKRIAPTVPLPTTTTQHGMSTSTVETRAPSIKNNATPTFKTHAPPPPVPPKPSSIPAGLVFSHRPTDGSKIQKLTKTVQHPVTMQKPTEAQQKSIIQSSVTNMALNLIQSTDYKLPSPTSPMSPHSNKSSPRFSKSSLETYAVITLPSEPGTPVENDSVDTTCWPLQPPLQEISSMVPSSKADQNVTSFKIHTVPSVGTYIITKEITKTTVSLPQSIISDIHIMSATIPKETAIAEDSEFNQTSNITDPNDIIDLRTLSKMDYKNNDSGIDICMDLSSAPLDVKLQSSAHRQISAIQPAIVNLSTASPATSSITLVTETVTIVTCSTTVSYTSSLESLVDIGKSMETPLKLTKSKQFEGSLLSSEEVPINLSLGTPTHSIICASTKTTSLSPVSVTNGYHDISTSQESVDSGVVDLSTSKTHRTMVTVDEITSDIVTAIIDDDKPVDLTAGRRAVCCDVVYNLPFGRSCISQQPATTLPEDRFGYRDDHYQYDRSGLSGFRAIGGMKPSMSDTNLAEAGVFLYKSKNTFDFPGGLTEAAVDLTSGKITTGEALDYQTKTTGVYPGTRQVISGIGISAPQYSQARITPSVASQYGIGSVLRSSNGVVYSSVATPIPSTFAITTQPGSIFSTTVQDLSSFTTSDTISSISNLNQTQPLPRPYNMLPTTAADVNDVMMVVETSLQSFPMEVTDATPRDLTSILTTESETFSEMIEDESTYIIHSEDGKQQQLELQRELLELEKLKQQRLAEELEWERQEIQRFREQETLMVQKKLEELQSMKQHLLYQQEEERQAQLMMRQETFAQQQLHREQIQQLHHQLHQQLEEQKLRQMYQYGYEPGENSSPQTTSEQVILESQFQGASDSQFWSGDLSSTTTSVVAGMEIPSNESWYPVQPEGMPQYIARPGILNSVSEISLKDIDINDDRKLKKRSSMPRICGMFDEVDGNIQDEPRSYKLIVDSGVQTDDEDAAEKGYTGRRRRTKKGVDTSVQTDDEDQEEWDIPSRSRRKSRTGKYSDGHTDADKFKQSKVSSIAVQTVAEMSVQTEPFGTIRTPSIRAKVDAKVEIIKHISAPEKSCKGQSLGCQTETDSESQSSKYLSDVSQRDKRRPTPLEIGYSSHLRADSSLQVAPSPPKSPKVLYSPISPLSPSKALESAFVPYEKNIVDDIGPHKQHTDGIQIPPPSPKSPKVMQRSMSDPKPLSPTAEEASRTQFQYSDGYMTKGNKTFQSGTQKKVKRTLPNPPPEDANSLQSPYGTVGSASRRRICRTTTMARAKILQDIDRELDLVERESSKLRKKQAELDEEEKEIDAKLRYLEMGINRRKEALLKEREKRERAYLQGVAEERDYMSDSEVSSTRPTRIESHLGLDRPQTAAQTDFSSYLPPQTQSESQFAPPTSPYTQYQYQTPTLLTQAPTQYPQQSHFPPSLYHQQVSSYQSQPTFQAVPTMSYTPQPQSTSSQQTSYQHASQMMLLQQKSRQDALDLDSKITSHYDVIRNQPLIIAPVSSDNSYSVSHLGNKYSTLDLRLGLDEKSSMASSPMSSISADSFYADLEHHASRNYVLIDDIGELTKGSGSLSSAFALHDKELSKADRLLRTIESRRTPEVTDFLSPLPTSSRLHSYGKTDEDSMEDPYELKLLKHQIKQEFRRGTDSLDPLSGFSPYYHSDSLYRHLHKNEKYSIGRLTLEKQAAKQLPPAILYQKQSKHKKSLIDPKVAKFSPIQESRDLEPDYSSYLSSSTSSIPSISSKVRLLQDDITYGLRKNITDQQKFLGPALVQNIGTTLTPNIRTSLQDEVDKPYASGSRSRPSSRPSSVYGLDLSIKRDLSSSSLRLKANEAEQIDGSFSHVAPSGRTKPSSLPISQSRGRIPIVAQNSEEESPLSPVGQPMGMARAAAGPLPPISADTRDQFGSSHSLPEVQQHMREESRTRGYDRDIAFIMDDFQHAMSDSEAYHLRREETDWFDKPRESRLENGIERKLADKLSHARQSQQQEQVRYFEMNGKPVHYVFPYARIKLQRDPKDHTVSGNGFGIRVVGGKEIPGTHGEIGAYIAKILAGGGAEHTGRLTEGMQVLEWSNIPLTAKTYEEVHSIISQSSGEAEICVRLDMNMFSNSETPQNLEVHDPGKAVEKTRSPGVDPKQLAAELQKVSQQQAPSAIEKGSYIHSGTTSAASSAVPSPGQPGSPSVSKKRHSSKSTETIKVPTHPITGEIQLQVTYDKHLGNLIIHILQARNLVARDNNGYSDPFVKVYLLPGRGQVMVVQNASAEYKRRTKYVQKSLNPEWNQTVIYKNISMEQIKKKTLEVTVWDYDRFSSNDFLGEVLIDLSNTSNLDNMPRWYPLKEQTESFDQAKSHSGQNNQQVTKPSVIKSRSHGIFPDPSKDMQVPTIEKSHSSPGSSKSSSEGHLRSHGPSRSQSKTSVTQTHLEDAGAAIAAAEAAVQQLRLQPTRSSPHRTTESSVSTASSVSSVGSGFGMESESSSTTGESNVFPVPRIGKMNQNGQDLVSQSGIGLGDNEGKTQVMGEIKIALKKEMKTDGEQLIVEILQCRNITYKFKSPDHLPDLYVKLYVINIATQKRIIKKKTRVCRHDREPSFNETFRFSMSPAGHSLQILLVSNGGKFMKKTLIGEAYISLDKVDLRKRLVNWYKLLVSPTQTH